MAIVADEQAGTLTGAAWNVQTGYKICQTAINANEAL